MKRSFVGLSVFFIFFTSIAKADEDEGRTSFISPHDVNEVRYTSPAGATPLRYPQSTTSTKPAQSTPTSTTTDKAQQGLSGGEKCKMDLAAYKAATDAVTKTQLQPRADECDILFQLGKQSLDKVDTKESTIKSGDGKIQCIKKETYTVDYDPCERAVSYYNTVVNAEAAMNVQQQIRTDVKNKNIQQDANKKVVAGDAQTGMFDAAIESNNHQKNMQQEKMAAYGIAVTALAAAYRMIPTKENVEAEFCKAPLNVETCKRTITNNRLSILANQNAKSLLTMAIATFTAKAVAAGIAMGQYKNAAKQVAAAKQTVTDTSDDLMMERCVFNPTDPACAKNPTATPPRGIIGTGSFGVDPSIGNNSFNLTPDTDPTLDPTTDPAKDENAPVAGVNSPFADDLKKAKDIIDPAAAANMQAGTAPAGGSGGGAGGGGGGSASVGSDTAGADKDGNKEASIKAKELSGSYASGGGGGYKGVGRGKDDANPFSNLFDAKSDGGVEEDRSIASEDIDGSASGLFQKISKRYSQIQADKRIEAKNLE